MTGLKILQERRLKNLKPQTHLLLLLKSSVLTPEEIVKNQKLISKLQLGDDTAELSSQAYNVSRKRVVKKFTDLSFH